ncbi:MAG: SUMF1/EgtB/PvdO family nonheme iron enzyme, partial [Lacunisphaera sp.]|nr:SUMF1/EgtB/PvdO family nonheme iron enzyme [Lacunisphaera sp.]
TKQEREKLTAERLAAARGGLVVRTNPAGAEVRVGALALDKSPLTLKDQKLGKYPVRVRLEGYEEWTGEVEVKENDFADLDVTLVRSMGTLVITSSPAGAAILQDGKEIGRTPYNNRTQLGSYRFTLQQKGYKSVEVSGEVARNTELRLTAELEKFRGPETGQAWTIPDLSLVMQPIAPGTFQMGSANGDANEKPVTQVPLTKAYWLGKTEVTQAQWAALMGSNPSEFKGDDRPVEQVSWDEAMEYCRKLSARERAAGRLPEGYGYTLPTEAQWEYACRSGTTGDYAGNLDAMGWYESNSGKTTHAVGQKQANAWGLADMHGNVWEWCADWYRDHLAGGSVPDPTGAASGAFRVFRGGSWGDSANDCRSAGRGGDEPGLRFTFLGFRLALSSVP